MMYVLNMQLRRLLQHRAGLSTVIELSRVLQPQSPCEALNLDTGDYISVWDYAKLNTVQCSDLAPDMLIWTLKRLLQYLLTASYGVSASFIAAQSLRFVTNHTRHVFCLPVKYHAKQIIKWPSASRLRDPISELLCSKQQLCRSTLRLHCILNRLYTSQDWQLLILLLVSTPIPKPYSCMFH